MNTSHIVRHRSCYQHFLAVMCAISTATAAIEINVETYGADAAGLQVAINHVSGMGGGVVKIPAGVVVSMGGAVVAISTPNVHLKGDGSIKDGTITVGTVSPNVPVIYNTEIEGITFAFEALQAGNKAIVLQNAQRGSITNCLFLNCDAAISVPPIASPAKRHVAEFRISNNRFEDCNYVLRLDRIGNATTSYVAGDLHFINNVAACHICHIYGVGVEGLVINANTFFFPGSSVHSQTKTNNIFLNYCNNILITGNNLFEAGADAIELATFQNVSIVGNAIAWPGQRVPGSAIKMKGGAGSYSMSTIQGNTIMWPTEHGISLGDDCGYIAVTGNQVRAPGWGDRYYGSTDLSTVPHHGIYAGTATSNITVTGNVFTGAPVKGVNVLGANSQVSQSGELGSMTVSASPIDLSGFFGGTVTLAYGAAGTISSIVGGKPGQVVGFCGTNPTMTFAHSSNLRLKGAVNTTVPINSYLYLKCVNTQGNTATTGNAWIEVSRNY